MLHCSHTLPCTLEGSSAARSCEVAACPLPPSLEGGCQEPATRSFVVLGYPPSGSRPLSQPAPEGGVSAWGPARRSWPKVLVNLGARVSLPVAHYSDTELCYCSWIL